MNGFARLEAITTSGKSPTDCWIWDGQKDSYGYGVIEFEGRAPKAHRISYERAFGSIPVGTVLHHTCKHPECVNPFHMLPMSQSQHVSEHQERRGKGGMPKALQQGKQTIAVGVRFPPSMLARISFEQGLAGGSVGAFVRRAVAYWFEHATLADRCRKEAPRASE